LSFWRENVDKLIEYHDKKLLTWKGHISKKQMKNEVENLEALTVTIASNLLNRWISKKKNYVIELTGMKKEIFEYIMRNMKKIWYEITLVFVDSSVEQAQENDLSRSKTNMSSYYTEWFIYNIFRNFFEYNYNKLAREEWLVEIDI